MVRFVMCLFSVAAFCPTVSHAQWFPLLRPTAVTQVQTADGCITLANGQTVCPLVRSAAAVATAPIRAVQQARYGSSGNFGVGSIDRDGAVVTSVGVTVSQVQNRGVCDCCCPDCKCNQAQSSNGPVEMRGGLSDLLDRRSDRVKFRRALIEAAKQARSAGTITDGEMFLIRGLSLIPANLEVMQVTLHEVAIEEGMATPQAIDWDKLIALIIKWLPELIKLFS